MVMYVNQRFDVAVVLWGGVSFASTSLLVFDRRQNRMPLIFASFASCRVFWKSCEASSVYFDMRETTV